MDAKSQRKCSAAIHAEINDGIIGGWVDPIEELDRGRHLIDLIDHLIDQAREDRVDLVEVVSQRRQLVPGADRRGGDAEVEIDMRVHAHEQLLEDQRPPAHGRVEGHAPAPTRRPAEAELRQRRQVTICEGDIEPLHARPVVEAARRDAFLHPDRHPTIERREVSQAAPVPDVTGDEGVEGRDDLVDRRRQGDGAPASRWTFWVVALIMGRRSPADRDELACSVDRTRIAAEWPRPMYHFN